MKRSTIRTLNLLNKEFYQKTSTHFDSSRRFFWAGWEQLITYIQPLISGNELKVLDIGCGNGRFGEFLAKNFLNTKILYTGIDNDDSLLNAAQSRLNLLEHKNLFPSFKNTDIVEALLDDSFLANISNSSYDLVVIFGVLHHIPSIELRKKLLHAASAKLRNGGVLTVTAWQFLDSPRLKNKIIKPENAGIKSDDLENRDYLLDWQRGVEAIRFCHFINVQEIDALIKDLPNTKKIKQYRSDGKEGTLNNYLVLEKSVQ